MKLAITLLLSALAAVSAFSDSLEANSKLGRQLLSKATPVDQAARQLNNNNNDNENADLSAWVINYSLKFQGCHSIVQWNAAADDEQDVRLAQKRLVRFRLCPAASCSATDTAGCSAGYGDYVIDMQIFLNAWYEAKVQAGENECGQYAENNCACNGNGDDNFNENQCKYDCIVKAGMSQCTQYMQDQIYAESFEIEKYMECGQFKWNGNKNRRQLEEVQYYVGPYCSQQGGAILLGMFLDDACSVQVQDNTNGASTFSGLTGFDLPYHNHSIIGSECSTCQAVDENDNNGNNGNGNNDANAQLSEGCQTVYENAGKCESNLNATSTPNTQACTYIQGIKVVRADGMVFYQKPHSNAVSTSFIVIFAVAFFALTFYVWYLRTRLNMKPDALL